jgi:hypothetical protein
MAVLRTIESKLESLFEGVFGRAFRTNVQPVELARKLVKEMDDHKSVSVSRVYAPNEYTIFLAPRDRQQFDGYESQLCDELADYLAEHARRESYALVTRPIVRLETDDDLDVGMFGIATRMATPAGQSEGRPEPEPGSTMIYRPDTPLLEPAAAVPPAEVAPPQQESVAVSWEGRRLELLKSRTVIGRSKECAVQLADPNVSRRHAEIRREGDTYWLVDLDSTNGVEVDGKRVKRLKLEDGARFTVGSTEVTFSRELR